MTTYILQSMKDGSYYVGSTRNINARIIRHMNGMVCSTKNIRPVQLVYSEEYATYKEAFCREKQIKGWKSRAMIEKLIHGPVV